MEVIAIFFILLALSIAGAINNIPFTKEGQLQ
jgi:hypothetical protein